MKKGKAYVVKGASAESHATERTGPAPLMPLPEWLQPSTRGEGYMPHDYGMAGPVGAYEVKRIARSVSTSLRLLEKQLLDAEQDPIDLANDALDRLLPMDSRHKVIAERFEGKVLILSLANRADRFLMNRTLLPKLKTALKPKLGAISCRLIDR